LSTGANSAGFQLVQNTFFPGEPAGPIVSRARRRSVAAVPLASGSEENLFYGVGTLNNGAPNIQPNQPVRIPSAPRSLPHQSTKHRLGNSDASRRHVAHRRAHAKRILSAPASHHCSSPAALAIFFTSVPLTNSTTGNEALALSVTTIVAHERHRRFGPDYNHNGIVDAADYILWRKTVGLGGCPTRLRRRWQRRWHRETRRLHTLALALRKSDGRRLRCKLVHQHHSRTNRLRLACNRRPAIHRPATNE